MNKLYVQACAEVYSEVASSCTMESRYTMLTPVFLKLLRDDSKWVSVSTCVWRHVICGGV